MYRANSGCTSKFLISLTLIASKNWSSSIITEYLLPYFVSTFLIINISTSVPYLSILDNFFS